MIPWIPLKIAPKTLLQPTLLPEGAALWFQEIKKYQGNMSAIQKLSADHGTFTPSFSDCSSRKTLWS